VNEPDSRPTKRIVDPDGERDDVEHERLTAELHRFVEQPDWAEQLAAMPTDAERAAAVRKSFLAFLNAQGTDLWQHAYSLRTVAAQVRQRGDASGHAIAAFLEEQAADLERGAEP
jgi:hypothetical protein